MAQAAIRLVINDSSVKPNSGGELPPFTPPDRDALLAHAYQLIEGPLSELEYMARLANEAVQRSMESTVEITGKPEWHYISDAEANMVIFAVAHLLELIQSARGKYYAAFDQLSAPTKV